MEFADIAQFIFNNGFAAFAFYLMYQMCNTTIKDNTKATSELLNHLKSLKKE